MVLFLGGEIGRTFLILEKLPRSVSDVYSSTPQFSEVHLRAKWALSGFQEDIHTVDDLIGIICSKWVASEFSGFF
jgi:hypothetical protein